MAKKDKKKKKYRMVVFDEVSLDEQLNVTVSKTKILFLFISLIITISVLVGVAFVFTPLKYFLPPEANYRMQNDIFNNKILIDSLTKEITSLDNYFNKLNSIMYNTGVEELTDESNTSEQLLTQQEKDSVLQSLLERDELSLANIRTNEDDLSNNFDFVKPIENYIILSEFNSQKKHYGIEFKLSEEQAVKTVLPGAIMFSDSTQKDGYIMQVQHSNNLVSIYRHLNKPLKNVGDKVFAGDKIALSGGKNDEDNFIFEVWQYGIPINPANYIDF